MSRQHERLDEDDVRVRPGRHKSRPRTKDRPEHLEATDAQVTTVDRGRFTILYTNGAEGYAVKARELGRKGIVVGDRVHVVGDPTGGLDSPARIVRREERSSVLRRTADDSDPVERILVANADQLAVVTATANPAPSPGLIDRALVAALDAGLRPILIITKVDVASPDELIATYAPLDVPIYLIGNKQVTEELRAALADHHTVLVGHSGVGKSTMVNELVPDADRRIGHVNLVTGKGRHTSTSAIDFPLASGGSIIDTPGIRSFGLAHVTVEALIRPFEDLHALTEDCPRSCSHDEPDCALNNLSDPVLVSRVAGLRRLLRSRSESTD